MNVRDIWMRHTDKHGHSYVAQHRVWDADKFISNQVKAAEKEGGKAEQITQEQFKKEHTK